MSISEAKMLVIDAVRTARNEARDARFNESFSPQTRKQLEELYSTLDKAEDDLILAELDEGLGGIEKSVQKIEDIDKKIEETNEQLERISKAIDIAARGLKVLIKIATTATGSGMI
jgi:DNA repair exonuclease SbcCD ATPase subunit